MPFAQYRKVPAATLSAVRHRDRIRGFDWWPSSFVRFLGCADETRPFTNPPWGQIVARNLRIETDSCTTEGGRAIMASHNVASDNL